MPVAVPKLWLITICILISAVCLIEMSIKVITEGVMLNVTVGLYEHTVGSEYSLVT